MAVLHLLSSLVTGAGTQCRTGGPFETRAGIFDENTQRGKDAGRTRYSTAMLYRPPRKRHQASDAEKTSTPYMEWMFR